jgi:hypothetical protein
MRRSHRKNLVKKKHRDTGLRLWHHIHITPSRGISMTNSIAIGLGVLILGALGLDAFLFDWSNSVFLARKLTDLIEWMAFWR